MSLETIVQALGGLALFLFAMQRMTEGLTVFAGSGLKQLLGRWTSNPLRGVFAGILVTGLVQSSSAVTVATIGFVNAGLLTLRQALGVIFGTNVGTTMTGWLVSLVGFGFRIETFALPILTVGVVLRLVASGRRYQGLGEALAGFGLFFLGLALLKDAFGGMAEAYGAAVASGGAANWPAFVLVGFIATVLTQSSSAAIAIILTAAAGGVVGLEAAAAAVIGANLGTTSTAAVAVLKATPAAKRLALGHIAFNVVTGLVALALLPVMLAVVARLADWLDVERSPAAILALFHTVFNVLGVLLMLPLADRLALLLERMFRSDEEDLARPQHLDATLAAAPTLAVAALQEELARLRGIVTGIVGAALSGSASALQRQSAAVRALFEAIVGFVSSVRAESMPEDVGAELAGALSAARYLQEAATLAPGAAALRARGTSLDDAATRAMIERFLADAERAAGLAGQTGVAPDGDARRSEAIERLQGLYRETKEALLVAAVAGRLSVVDTDALLDELRATRRLVEQLLKADRLLRSPARAAEIEAETDATAGGAAVSAA
jgi:phosphate:Na+ symporter